MSLPTPFRFSQSNLQDYIECRKRFQLRYLQNLAWPAIQAEPAMEVERHLQLGALFHRLIQQHLLGLPIEPLSRMAHPPELALWWSNYLSQFENPKGFLNLFGEPFPEEPLIQRQAEIALLAPLNQHLLIAQYDVILTAVYDTSMRLLIIEWKTSTRRPKRQWLAQRVQTRLYPYVLVRAGRHLSRGQPILPEQVEMVYWFAEFPSQPERFAYTQAQFEQDQAFLMSLIHEIESLDEQEFVLTEHEEHCRFCVYRSLCERGISAAHIAQAEDSEPQVIPSWETDLNVDFDFDQIAELEY